MIKSSLPVVLWSALALMVPLPAGAQVESEYVLRDHRAPTGSRIKRHNISPLKYPVNKPYGDFSAAEKAAFHAHFEGMPPGDEPPFPVAGLKEVLEAVALAQENFLDRGDLSLIAHVGANGVATKVSALKTPSPEMAQVAGKVLLAAKYKPAVCGGKPCAGEFPLMLEFRVQGSARREW